MKIEELPEDSLVLILDADPISYAISHEMKNWGDNTELGESLLNDYITNLLKNIGHTHFIGFVGGKGNFRDDLAVTKPYKENRKEKSERDTYWKQYVSQYLINNYQLQRVDNIEADDAVSITANRLEKLGISYIIACNDKDLDQVTGNHCKFGFNSVQFYYVDEWSACKNLATQLLTGDPTDTVPGLPGRGVKYAQWAISLCNDVDELAIILEEEYSKMGNTYFHEQLGLLGLLTEYPPFQCEFYEKDQQKLDSYQSKSEELKINTIF